MKRNNRRNIFGLIGSIILLTLFAGCSNIDLSSELKNDELQKCENQIIVTGKIKPEVARSANTSFAMDESYTMSINAFKGDNENPIPGTIEGNSYSLALPSAGDWTIRFYVDYKNSVLVNESVTVSIPEKADSFEITKPLLIRSGYPVTFTGGINLTFKDESKKIAKMTYSATVASDVEIGNENSLATGGSIAFVDGECTLALNNIKPNPYKLTFYFNDAAGNTLYKCYEDVTVYGGFTTDTWIGEGAHFKKTGAVTEFVITDNLIEKFGTEVVPVSKVLMYGRPSNENNFFNYYITDTVTSSLPESVSFTNASYFDDYIGYAKNYSCFDSDGYYYVITRQADDATYITSNKPDFGTNGVYMTAFNIGNFFSIDRKTGDAYAYNPDYSSITKLTENGNWLDGSQATSYKLMYEGEAIRCDDVFAINDGVAYLTQVTDNPYASSYFYVADLKTAENDSDGSLFVVVEQYTLPAPYANPRVTDMLYQDGYVYLLLRYLDYLPANNLNFYSTGAIVRYNTFTKNFDDATFGLADAIEHGDNAYVELQKERSDSAFYTYDSSNADRKALVAKASEIKVSEDGSQALNFYAPKTILSESSLQLSNKAFYGPQKFIAVKPKRLVISDDGLAFYTDADGIYKYKNVNRIVIVDLEKFAEENASFESVETSLEFDFKENNGSQFTKTLQDSGSYWEFSLQNNVSLYVQDTKEVWSNCFYDSSNKDYNQGTDFKLFAPGANLPTARPIIRRED